MTIWCMWEYLFTSSSPTLIVLQSTLVISTSGISTLRICRRICKVPNSVPIHCIYNFADKSTFRLPRHVFRSQTMFSINLIVCLDNHCIHNASCENCDRSVYFLAKFDTSNLSWGDVIRSLDMQGIRNRGACVIKSWLSNTCNCLSHF